MPQSALAHTPGLSQADFDVRADGRVDGRFVFANAEAFGGEARALVEGGVDVAADDAKCAATVGDAFVTETDGIEVDASYACSAGASTVEATLYFLSSLPRGHKMVARIASGSTSSQAVLGADHRAIALRLPVNARAQASQRKGRIMTAVAAAFAVLMLGLFVWRFVATRKR